MALTKNQLEAINSDVKHVLVVAGAGAGKTKVLTERIGRLIKENKCNGENILCLTFTRNSGKEMKDRIAKLIGLQECKNIFCNTFHAFCISVLKEWGYKLGYFDNFSIFTKEEQIELIKSIIVELCIVQSLSNVKPNDIKKVLLCLKHPEYTKLEYPKLAQYIAAAAEYKFKLRKNSAIDLDMLLTETVRVLNNEDVKQYYEKFKYCFVDEFQDTNDTQLSIIQALNPENSFFVGDVDQCIYKWRGANPENMLNFSKHYNDAKIITLEDNFRSTYDIVKAANNVIKHNKNRFDKKLIAHKEGPKVDILRFENPEIEAEQIGKFIKYSRKKIGDYFPGDFAVLARTNSMLSVVSKTFKKLGIQINTPSNKDILNREDVQGIFNFIDSTLNTSNDMSIKRAINFPEELLTPEQISKVELKCLESEQTFFETLKACRFKEQDKIDRYLKRVNNIKQFILSNNGNALDVVKYTIDVLSLNHICNLKNIYSKIESWCVIQKRNFTDSDSIEYFLKWLKVRDHLDVDTMEKNNDKVHLMTIHGSKGLEFPIVFIIGMIQGIFPNKRSCIEDEHNLAYVAMTRPQDKLYLSTVSNVTYRNGFTRKAHESVFISEILK